MLFVDVLMIMHAVQLHATLMSDMIVTSLSDPVEGIQHCQDSQEQHWHGTQSSVGKLGL